MIGYSKKVACFRSPMSCHNNIRVMNVVRDYEIDFWYQYMTTVNIINGHDMFYPAENGADNDGDSIMTTDNEVLLRKWRDTPAILCIQKQADKKIINPENLAWANENGFGNDVGSITNRVTAMYDVMAKFDKDSEQYKTLEYRIMCGQHFQQGSIDRVKGIACTPMPKYWYDWHSVKASDKDSENKAKFKERNRELIADKKPYFMIYIYHKVSKEYKKYRNSVEVNCSL